MRGISVSERSDKPIYQQLYEQISSQILRGELTGDLNLPPIRTAARELRVSIITVKKAWEELERAGFIYTVTGKGCFVSPFTSRDLEEKRKEIILERLDRDLAFYRNLGVSREEFVRLIKGIYDPGKDGKALS